MYITVLHIVALHKTSNSHEAYNVRAVSSALWGSFFLLFQPQRIVRNEPNLGSFPREYRRSDAADSGSVLCLMVREKIDVM